MRVNINSAKVIVLICVFVVMLQPHLAAQTASAESRTGTLKAVVIDSSINARIVGASVTIEGKYIRRVVASDDEGWFKVELPAGNYRIIVTATGFGIFRRKGLKVRAGSTTELDVPTKLASSGCAPASGVRAIQSACNHGGVPHRRRA